MNTYKIKNIFGTKDTYTIIVNDETMILSIENQRTKAIKEWNIDVDNKHDLAHSYIYKFYKRKVKTMGLKELNKIFKEMKEEGFISCRFSNVLEKFGL